MIYVCPHYADPFTELIFETREEAETYTKAYKQETNQNMEIREEEE